MTKNNTDLIDKLTVETYCKKYEEENFPWSNTSRLLFNEALNFIFDYILPENGKCVEIGVYKGESFKKLIGKYGLDVCLGIDVKNYSNLPNVIVIDIRKFYEEIQVRVGINDVSVSCPESKLFAHKWLCKNTIKNGVIMLTGYREIDLREYDIKNLQIIYQNPVALVFRKAV